MIIPEWLTDHKYKVEPPPEREHVNNVKWTRKDENSNELIIADGKKKSFNMGKFSKALKVNDVLDNETITLPGSMIILPYGVRLLDQFIAIVKNTYRKYALQEYNYPVIAPKEIYEKQSQIMNLENKLLYVGTSGDFLNHSPRGILNPTGEATIYTHWRTLIRTKEDLPLKMYRRASYFRPFSKGKHSGRSIFKSLESGDVFEFHLCYPSLKDSLGEMEQFKMMLDEISNIISVPTIWSLRPPWTNNENIAHWTIGGDVPLPLGNTVQTCCLYNQGQIFSEKFDIKYKQGNEYIHTSHITGAITRRILLTHLLLGMRTSGDLFLHPNIAPDQVNILFRPGLEEDCPEEIQYVYQQLQIRSIRVNFKKFMKKNEFIKELKLNKRSGVPVQVIVYGKREADERVRVIIIRSDTLEEANISEMDLSQLPFLVEELIDEIGAFYQKSVREFYNRQVVFAENKVEVIEFLAEKKVVSCPLDFSNEKVLEIANYHMGEVLGFVHESEEKTCVLSGSKTKYIAYISGRI
ncbi:hypothetical protein [Paenibacillus sp. YYML68]|uniref:hypothetical protein n=1 Tax=Paenibacillus sp. YYML68 TaxID=2909250 RepID=UPI002490DB4A|nr:hypothetical protein [Paenibacillus sp. YYML68]